MYKIIAKVIENRMSVVLKNCMDEAQGAFILCRQISDNVLTAYKILHSLRIRRSSRHGNFALKLDMSKAYNRVE